MKTTWCESLWPVIATGALLLVTAGPAEARTELRFSRTTDLPNVGLRLKLMPEFKERPLPPPTSQAFTRGNERMELYTLFDLWYRTQHAGAWVDDNENSMTLAVITAPLPAAAPGQGRTTLAEFGKRTAASATNPPASWTPERLSAWAADFTEARSATAQTLPRKPGTLAEVVSFACEGIDPGTVCYAFRLNRAASGQSRAPQDWFFVMFALGPSDDVEKARKTIQEDFLPSITVARSKATGDVGPSKTFQNKPGAKLQRSPEFIASRDQVADSIRNMKDWWFVETENYIILSNLKSRYRDMVRDLQTHIEALRSGYELCMPPPGEIKAISVIRVFGTAEEYQAYVPREIEWSSGVWMPEKKELVIKPTEWGGSKEQREMTLHITSHEAFHQYLFYSYPSSHPAMWFNEGHADFFGAAKMENRKLEIGENESRARLLDTLILGSEPDLRALLAMDRDAFYGGGETGRSEHYALAWAVVYYLRKECEFDTSSPYARVLSRYAEALARNGDGDAATRAAFGGIDLTAFQKDFTKFWRSNNKRARAAKNKTAAEGRIAP